MLLNQPTSEPGQSLDDQFKLMVLAALAQSMAEQPDPQTLRAYRHLLQPSQMQWLRRELPGLMGGDTQNLSHDWEWEWLGAGRNDTYTLLSEQPFAIVSKNGRKYYGKTARERWAAQQARMRGGAGQEGGVTPPKGSNDGNKATPGETQNAVRAQKIAQGESKPTATTTTPQAGPKPPSPFFQINSQQVNNLEANMTTPGKVPDEAWKPLADHFNQTVSRNPRGQAIVDSIRDVAKALMERNQASLNSRIDQLFGGTGQQQPEGSTEKVAKAGTEKKGKKANPDAAPEAVPVAPPKQAKVPLWQRQPPSPQVFSDREVAKANGFQHEVKTQGGATYLARNGGASRLFNGKVTRPSDSMQFIDTKTADEVRQLIDSFSDNVQQKASVELQPDGKLAVVSRDRMTDQQTGTHPIPSSGKASVGSHAINVWKADPKHQASAKFHISTPITESNKIGGNGRDVMKRPPATKPAEKPKIGQKAVAVGGGPEAKQPAQPVSPEQKPAPQAAQPAPAKAATVNQLTPEKKPEPKKGWNRAAKPEAKAAAGNQPVPQVPAESPLTQEQGAVAAPAAATTPPVKETPKKLTLRDLQNKPFDPSKSLAENAAQPEVLQGGKADNVPDSALPPKQLEEGKKVESEHTSNPKVADEIAKDHLVEDPNYYDKLKKVEQPDAAKPAAAAEPHDGGAIFKQAQESGDLEKFVSGLDDLQKHDLKQYLHREHSKAVNEASDEEFKSWNDMKTGAAAMAKYIAGKQPKAKEPKPAEVKAVEPKKVPASKVGMTPNDIYRRVNADRKAEMPIEELERDFASATEGASKAALVKMAEDMEIVGTKNLSIKEIKAQMRQKILDSRSTAQRLQEIDESETADEPPPAKPSLRERMAAKQKKQGEVKAPAKAEQAEVEDEEGGPDEFEREQIAGQKRESRRQAIDTIAKRWGSGVPFTPEHLSNHSKVKPEEAKEIISELVKKKAIKPAAGWKDGAYEVTDRFGDISLRAIKGEFESPVTTESGVERLLKAIGQAGSPDE